MVKRKLLSISIDTRPSSPTKTESALKKEKLRHYEAVCTKLTEDIFIGGELVAKSYELLKSHSITAIVNCASLSCRNYFPKQFNYLSIPLQDDPSENLQQHLPNVCRFVEEEVLKGGKVLIHCIR